MFYAFGNGDGDCLCVRVYVVGEGALIHELYKAGFTITKCRHVLSLEKPAPTTGTRCIKAKHFSSPMARALSPPTRIPTVAAHPGLRRAVLKRENFRPEAVLCQPAVDHPRGIKQNTRRTRKRPLHRRRQPAHRHSGGVRGRSGTILVLSGVSTINDIDGMPFRPSWLRFRR